MKNNQPIGGFFELELSEKDFSFHPDAIALSTGRACIKFILEKVRPQKVYVPFYTCYALFEPMIEMDIPVEFYAIDEQLSPKSLPDINHKDLFFYINYFGLKNNQVSTINEKYQKQLIIDDTHRFFHKGYESIVSFTSARKYFGVPDGAYLYSANISSKKIEEYPRFSDISLSHNVKRLIGLQEEAYAEYRAHEDTLDCSIHRISLVSEQLLSNIDYKAVGSKRVENFSYLNKFLRKYNKLEIDIDSMGVPFCYPFLPSIFLEKEKFYKNNIFIPTLWPDVLERKGKGFDWEKEVTRKLLPIPIDQRYGQREMDVIIEQILRLI